MQLRHFFRKKRAITTFLSQKRAITTFLSRKFMITRSSIAYEDFLGSSISSQVMPPWNLKKQTDPKIDRPCAKKSPKKYCWCLKKKIFCLSINASLFNLYQYSSHLFLLFENLLGEIEPANTLNQNYQMCALSLLFIYTELYPYNVSY